MKILKPHAHRRPRHFWALIAACVLSVAAVPTWAQIPMAPGAPVSLPTPAAPPPGAPAWSPSTDVPVRPGLWSFVVRGEFPGLPVLPPPRPYSLCISESDVREGLIRVQNVPVCNVQGGTWTDGALALRLSCGAEVPEGHQISGRLQPGGAGLQLNGAVQIVVRPQATGNERGQYTYHQVGAWQGPACN